MMEFQTRVKAEEKREVARFWIGFEGRGDRIY